MLISQPKTNAEWRARIVEPDRTEEDRSNNK